MVKCFDKDDRTVRSFTQETQQAVFPAHIREGSSGQEVQTAGEHCRNTAVYAGKCLRGIGLEQAGMLAGLVHDCGKFKTEFAKYLKDPNAVRGTVNHTFAGFRLLMERYHGEAAESMKDLTAELLALAVGGHHGLFDCVDESRKSGLLHRMTKRDIGYDESRRNFLEQCASGEELDKRFAEAHAELLSAYEKFDALTNDPEEYAFYYGLLARLLLSAVIEGDRRDTAEFMCRTTYPEEPNDMRIFWNPYLERLEEKLSRFPQDTPIQKARREISDRCRAFAEKPGGIYRLNVPTGAGKTLSSLRYALAHGQKWGKRRLIFTSPLLSILEQNAEVIRDCVGDNSIILEHHSNVLLTKEEGDLDLRELAVESWNAPIIITTLVQFLNTLFEGKSTSIRRFQGLCKSVIVIDEVQTVPPRMLALFNCAIDFLSEVCGATVLLCSATQPCLEEAVHPLHRCRGDVIPYEKDLWEPFRRTVITDAGSQTLEDAGAFALHSLEEVRSLLVVCNKKDEAEYLFNILRDHADMSCHLSASMCTAHRRNALNRLEKALESGKKCVCVATQVIEAGVDISFERVIRLSAGMDNVIQAAGRCNRHGEREEPVPVYVVPCLGEKLGMLRDIQDAKAATDCLLDAFRRDPERFDCDLSSDKAIGWYYRKLYASMPSNYQDYWVKAKGVSLFELMSCNYKYFDETAPYASKFSMTQAFQTAGSLFRVFESDTRDLIVPYGEGAELIAELTGRSGHSPVFLADWQRRARPYTVAVYDWQLQRLGNAVTEHGGVAVLSPGFYDENTGLCLRPGENNFLEV